MDVAMPGLSGVETIRRARERWPALRALFISGYTDIASADLQTGDDPMLKKPFRFTDLTDAVRDAMKRVPTERAATVVRLGPRQARSSN
jgi:FixJ family two-component response regulator